MSEEPQHIVEEDIENITEEFIELNVATENIIIIEKEEFKQSY